MSETMELIEDGYRTTFFLKYEGIGEKQVSMKDWIKAERQAGFRPRMSSDDPRYMTTMATGGFGSGNLSGSIKFEKISELGDF